MKVKNILCLFFLFTISSSFSQEPLYLSHSIPDNLKQNANAVLRNNSVEILIESQKKIKTTITRVVTVLNEAGNRYLQTGAGYDNYVKIKDIEAVIFDEKGKEIKKVKKKDFIDHSAVDGSTLYSDSRVLFLAYTPINYPYTVSFKCEIESSNTIAIPTWRPIDDYYFSIEKSSYSLTDNANLGIRYKEKNFDDFNVQSNATATSLSYAISNVPALKPEDLSPDMSDFTPQVMVAVNKFHYYGVDGEAHNWVEFGEWINNSLLKGRNIVSDETKQKILNLVSGIENPIEKAKKVYDFVQNNTRYISVQVGIGGIQPKPALEVDQLKYGDCKGLTNYTQALLDIAGVKSYYTVVEAGSEIVDFDDDFASLEQGNHIILGIPNDDAMIWLDCTSQLHPFGFIGDFTDNRKVLVVKEGESEILKTSSYIDDVNYQNISADIVLEEDASINSKVSITTKGIQYDNRFFIERAPKKEIVEYYKEYWSYVNNLEIDNYVFSNDKNKVEFSENVEIFARNYATTSQVNLIFSPNAFNRNTFIPSSYKSRELPFEIQRGYLDEDSFNYTIPDGYQIEGIPENTSLKNQFGEYEIELSVEDNKIFYKRKLLILKGKYSKSDYTSYKDFRKKVSALDNSKIILKKT